MSSRRSSSVLGLRSRPSSNSTSSSTARPPGDDRKSLLERYSRDGTPGRNGTADSSSGSRASLIDRYTREGSAGRQTSTSNGLDSKAINSIIDRYAKDGGNIDRSRTPGKGGPAVEQSVRSGSRAASVDPSSRPPMSYTSRHSFGSSSSSLSKSYHTDGSRSTVSGRYGSTEALNRLPPTYRTSALGGRSSSLSGSCFSLANRDRGSSVTPSRELDKYRPPSQSTVSINSTPSINYTREYSAPYRAATIERSTPRRESSIARSTITDRCSSPLRDVRARSTTIYRSPATSNPTRVRMEYRTTTPSYTSSNIDLSSTRRTDRERSTSSTNSSVGKKDDIEARFERLYNKYVRDSSVSDSDNEGSKDSSSGFDSMSNSIAEEEEGDYAKTNSYGSRSDAERSGTESEDESSCKSEASVLPSRKKTQISIDKEDSPTTPTPSRRVILTADIRDGSPTTPTPQRRVIVTGRNAQAAPDQLKKDTVLKPAVPRKSERSRDIIDRSGSTTPTQELINNEKKSDARAEGTTGTKAVVRRSASPNKKGTVNLNQALPETTVPGKEPTETSTGTIKRKVSIKKRSASPGPVIQKSEPAAEGAKKKVTLRKRSQSPVVKAVNKVQEPKEVNEPKDGEGPTVIKQSLDQTSVPSNNDAATPSDSLAKGPAQKTVLKKRSCSPAVKGSATVSVKQRENSPSTVPRDQAKTPEPTVTRGVRSQSTVASESGDVKVKLVIRRSQSPAAVQKLGDTKRADVKETVQKTEETQAARSVPPKKIIEVKKAGSEPKVPEVKKVSEKVTGAIKIGEVHAKEQKIGEVHAKERSEGADTGAEDEGLLGTVRKIELRKRITASPSKPFQAKKPEDFIPSFTNSSSPIATPEKNTTFGERQTTKGPSATVASASFRVQDSSTQEQTPIDGASKATSEDVVQSAKEGKKDLKTPVNRQKETNVLQPQKTVAPPVVIVTAPEKKTETSAKTEQARKSNGISRCASELLESVEEVNRTTRAKSQTPTSDRISTLKKRRDRGRTLESLKESLEADRKMNSEGIEERPGTSADTKTQNFYSQTPEKQEEKFADIKEDSESEDEEKSMASCSSAAISVVFSPNGYQQQPLTSGVKMRSLSPEEAWDDDREVRSRILLMPQPLSSIPTPIIMLTQPSQPNTPSICSAANPQFWNSDSECSDEDSSEVESFTDDSEEFYESDFEYSISHTANFPAALSSSSADIAPLGCGKPVTIDATVDLPFLEQQKTDMRGRVEELLAKPPPLPLFTCSISFDGQVPGMPADELVSDSWGSAEEGSDAEHPKVSHRVRTRTNSTLDAYKSPTSFSSDEESNYHGQTVGCTLTLVQKAAMKESGDESESSEYYDSDEYTDEEYYDEDEEYTDEEYTDEEEYEDEEEFESEEEEAESIEHSFESASEKSMSPFIAEDDEIAAPLEEAVGASVADRKDEAEQQKSEQGGETMSSAEAQTVRSIDMILQRTIMPIVLEPQEDEEVEEAMLEEIPAEEMFESTMQEVPDDKGTKQINIEPTYVKPSEEKVEARSADYLATQRKPTMDHAKKAVIQPAKLEKVKVDRVETKIGEAPKLKPVAPPSTAAATEAKKATSVLSPKAARKAEAAKEAIAEDGTPLFGSTLSKIVAAGKLSGTAKAAAASSAAKDKSSVRKSALNMTAEEAKKKEKEDEEAAKKQARRYGMVGSLADKFKDKTGNQEEPIVYRRSKALQRRDEERPKRTYAPIIQPVMDDTFDKQMEELRSRMKEGTVQFQKEVADLTKGIVSASESAKLKEQEENHRLLMKRTQREYSRADDEKKRQRELRSVEAEKELNREEKKVRKVRVSKEGATTEGIATTEKAPPKRTVRKLKTSTDASTPTSSDALPGKEQPDVESQPEKSKVASLGASSTAPPAADTSQEKSAKKSAFLEALRNRKTPGGDLSTGGVRPVAAVPAAEGAAATKIRNAALSQVVPPVEPGKDGVSVRKPQKYGQRRKTDEIILPPKEEPKKKRRKVMPRLNRFIRSPGDVDVLLGWDKENTFEGLERKFAAAANDRIKPTVPPAKKLRRHPPKKIWISELTDIDKIYKTSELRDIIASAQG